MNIQIYYKLCEIRFHVSGSWLARGVGVSYLQCTVIGWFPDCCCCFWTAAMMLIIPFPSDGMPTSGQPWKWNSLTARDLFSCREKEKGECQLHRWQTLKYSAKRHINHVPEDPLKRTHSVIGDEKVSNSVAFTFLLPLQLNGHVPTNHHTVTRPILSTLLLQRVRKRQIYFSIAPPVRVENATRFLLLARSLTTRLHHKKTPL